MRNLGNLISHFYISLNQTNEIALKKEKLFPLSSPIKKKTTLS